MDRYPVILVNQRGCFRWKLMTNTHTQSHFQRGYLRYPRHRRHVRHCHRAKTLICYSISIITKDTSKPDEYQIIKKEIYTTRERHYRELLWQI